MPSSSVYTIDFMPYREFHGVPPLSSIQGRGPHLSGWEDWLQVADTLFFATIHCLSQGDIPSQGVAVAYD